MGVWGYMFYLGVVSMHVVESRPRGAGEINA